MYYNTNNEDGDRLSKSREKAVNQNVLVLNVFKLFPNDNLSPNEVAKYIVNTLIESFQ